MLLDIARELHATLSEWRQLRVQIADSPAQGTTGEEAVDCTRPAAPLPLPLPVERVDGRRSIGKEKEDQVNLLLHDVRVRDPPVSSSSTGQSTSSPPTSLSSRYM